MLNIKITLPQPSLSTSDPMIRHCKRVMKDLKRGVLLTYPRHFNNENIFVSCAVVIAESDHPIFVDMYWEGAIAESREFSRAELLIRVGTILKDFYQSQRVFCRFVYDDCPKSE